MIRIFGPCQFLPNRSGSFISSAVRQISTATFPLQIKFSPVLWAEPLKKKKRIDPAVIKAREDRKKRKIEKEIRKLEKLKRKLKPIEEMMLPFPLYDEAEQRKREVKLSEEVLFERKHILKEWSVKKNKEMKKNIKLLNTMMDCQQKALNELRLESEELYQAAVKIDPELIPFKWNGPVETPPIDNYPLPDGDYNNISKKWE